MLVLRWAAGVAAALLLASCGAVATTPAAWRSPDVATPLATIDTRVESTAPSGITCRFPDDPAARAVADRIIASEARIINAGPGSVAFAVHDDLTNTSCARNGDQPFESASVIKVATVAARLWQAETQGFELPWEERDLAELAITVSDNDSQQYLWQLVGGSVAIAEFFAAAGMADTIPSYSDDDWGLTRITATDQLRLVRQLVDGTLLTRADSDYLLLLMRQVDPEQVWGVNAGAPADAVVALKNGWLDDTIEATDELPEGGVTWTNNSIGHISAPGASYGLVVLSTGNAFDEEGRAVTSAVAAEVAAAVLGR